MDQQRFMLSQFLAALNNEHAFTPETHAMREQALEVLPDLLESGFELDNVSLDQLMTAYFLCTYCHTPKKHAIKGSINRLMRHNMAHHEIVDIPMKMRDVPLTPRLLIITNHFTSTHVMYRCFAKSLRALKERFECINLCLHQTDFIAAQLFHRVIQVNHSPINYLETIRQLRKTIIDIAPDVIVFADIAMHPFGVFLSNLRLAPLQVLLAGHPAPSQSDCIDAFLCEYAYRNYTKDYVEPVRFFPTEKFSIEAPKSGPLYPSEAQRPSYKGRATRIVIPSTLHKITYPFLRTLAVIGAETGAEFHMTSNITKGNAALAELLKLQVPKLTYYPALHYDKFLELVAMCDMFLMPYPFSGFSTILDCFTQGIPGVVLRGDGIESQQGILMTIRGGEENSCITESEAEYQQAAIRMATDANMREFFSFALDDLYGTEAWMQKALFAGPSNGIANTISDMFDTGPGSG